MNTINNNNNENGGKSIVTVYINFSGHLDGYVAKGIKTSKVTSFNISPLNWTIPSSLLTYNAVGILEDSDKSPACKELIKRITTDALTYEKNGILIDNIRFMGNIYWCGDLPVMTSLISACMDHNSHRCLMNLVAFEDDKIKFPTILDIHKYIDYPFYYDRSKKPNNIINYTYLLNENDKEYIEIMNKLDAKIYEIMEETPFLSYEDEIKERKKLAGINGWPFYNHCIRHAFSGQYDTLHPLKRNIEHLIFRPLNQCISFWKLSEDSIRKCIMIFEDGKILNDFVTFSKLNAKKRYKPAFESGIKGIFHYFLHVS